VLPAAKQMAEGTPTLMNFDPGSHRRLQLAGCGAPRAPVRVILQIVCCAVNRQTMDQVASPTTRALAQQRGRPYTETFAAVSVSSVRGSGTIST
jgi:hypothetical protein